MSQKDLPPSVVEKVTTLVQGVWCPLFPRPTHGKHTHIYIYINIYIYMNIYKYIYTHLIAEFYSITGVCSTVTVNAQLQTEQCEQAGIPPLVQGYSKLHLSMRVTACLHQT